MAYTEFCMRNGGSNLNAGSLDGSATEPGTTARNTYASGNWVDATGVFTVASGNPASDGVVAGMFASVYANGSTEASMIGRVTAADATTITVSLAARAGLPPGDGTGNRTLKIGGAWQGPTTTSIFPFALPSGGGALSSLKNVAGDQVRFNWKNDRTYSVTATVLGVGGNTEGIVAAQGYTTTYGDLGKATLDGGSPVGSSFTMFQPTMNASVIRDLIIQNNGDTSASTGLALGQTCTAERVIAKNITGNGFSLSAGTGVCVECEAYNCNTVNNSAAAGFLAASAGVLTCIRCISHDSPAAAGSGFRCTNSMVMIDCISESNAGLGIYQAVGVPLLIVTGCSIYNNGSDGLRSDTGLQRPGGQIENNLFIGNGTGGTGYGVNLLTTGGPQSFRIRNNAFFGNATGTTNGVRAEDETGSLTLSANPFKDAPNGDFSVAIGAVMNAARGSFQQTVGYTKTTTAYPDLGAVQHRDLAGSRVIGS